MKKLDEISMRKTSIFDLRNIARDLGVLSPTIYKKEELIVKISQILNGEVKPQVPKSRQGRPPKVGNKLIENNNNSFCFADFDEKNEDDEKYNFDSYFEEKACILSDGGFDYDDSQFTFSEGEGYLKFDQSGFGFLFAKGHVADAENAIYISQSHIVENNLRQGDYVRCTYKKVNSQNARYLISVDGIDRKSDTEYAKLICKKGNKNISFSSLFKKELLEGSRNILKVKSLKNIDSIIDSFSGPEGYSFVYLNLDVLPEDISSQDENFYTIIGDSEKKNIFTIELVLERVKRLIENGKKVIVIINELNKIIKYQNCLNGSNIYDIKNKSFELCFKLMKLASTYDNNSSATIFAILKDNNINDCSKYLENELDNMNCNFINLE